MIDVLMINDANNIIFIVLFHAISSFQMINYLYGQSIYLWHDLINDV